MRRMDALRKSDKAIVFVTHSLYQVEALCDSAIWLEHGKIREYGSANEVVRSYLDDQESRAMRASAEEGVAFEGRGTAATRAFFDARDAAGSQTESAPRTGNAMVIDYVQVLAADGKPCNDLPFLSECTIRIKYHCDRPIHQPLFNLRLFHGGRDIFEASMVIDGPGPSTVVGSGVVECHIPLLPLTPKIYEIKMFVRSGDGIADLIEMKTVARIRVTDQGLDAIPLRGPMAINHLKQGSPVYVPRTWRFFTENKLTDTVESRYS